MPLYRVQIDPMTGDVSRIRIGKADAAATRRHHRQGEPLEYRACAACDRPLPDSLRKQAIFCGGACRKMYAVKLRKRYGPAQQVTRSVPPVAVLVSHDWLFNTGQNVERSS